MLLVWGIISHSFISLIWKVTLSLDFKMNTWLLKVVVSHLHKLRTQLHLPLTLSKENQNWKWREEESWIIGRRFLTSEGALSLSVLSPSGQLDRGRAVARTPARQQTQKLDLEPSSEKISRRQQDIRECAQDSANISLSTKCSDDYLEPAPRPQTTLQMPSSRIFCEDGNAASMLSNVVVRCGYWSLEMYLAQLRKWILNFI